MSSGVALIRERARGLPDAPGVYVFRDRDGAVLYVGKAKALRRRVGSYARPERSLERRTADLVVRVADIEITETGSETEALLLEQTLVKRHRPPFNIRLRDDKSYPMIAVTVGDRYPRVMFTRRTDRRDARLFGPYPSARKVRETLDTLGRIFPFRPCEGPTPGRRSGVPCLDFHIGRCPAPCIGAIDDQAYAALIDDVIRFLEGDTRTVARRLEAEMREAAAAQRYEEAARARNRLEAVRMFEERQRVDRVDAGDADVLAVGRAEDLAVVQIWPQRDGRLIDRIEVPFDNAADASLDALLRLAAAERYGAGAAVPPLVLVPDGLEEPDRLRDLLAAYREGPVEVRVPRRGERRRLLGLAERNARLAVEGLRLGDTVRETNGERALEDLRERLDLERLPERIECYDISTLGGEAQFASMVVFEHGRARRDHYRTFAIRHGRLDDVASLREAIRRRVARLGDGETDPSFSRLPDLIVIDGGKGQLNGVVAELDDADLPRLPVVGLAKRNEEVHIPGRPLPVILDDDAPGLLLLRRIRDEAHRVAIGRQRHRHATDATASVLDGIPGVGPVRRRALLRHFGSVDGMLQATEAEFEAVPGVPPKVARQIHASLHRIGGPTPGARVRAPLPYDRDEGVSARSPATP